MIGDAGGHPATRSVCDHDSAAGPSHPAAYDEAVYGVVDLIPPGRVLSYGDIAELLGGFGPRRVALAMTRSAGAVAWHRVVRADGSPAPHLVHEQLARLRAEATPLRGDRVDMSLGRWAGPPPDDQVTWSQPVLPEPTRQERTPYGQVT